jgi:hypothetical protein
VSGITPARKAIAPTLTEEPKGADPQKEFLQRQREAIAKATGNEQKEQDAAAGEDAAPPPKAKDGKTSSTSTAAATTETTDRSPASASPTAPGSKDPKGKPPSSDASSTPGGAATEATERRYDVQSIRKWAEKNPEEAAIVREKVFGLPPDTNQEWIRLKNRKRKLSEEIDQKHETTMAEAKAERAAAEEAKAAIDGAAQKLAPIADLWEAVAEKIAADPQNPSIDFEAADAAFLENAKISIDDYMRLRARRAIGSGPDAVKLRAENARLKRELAGKPSEAIKIPKVEGSPTEKEAAGTAEPSTKVKTKAPRDWSGELASGHKLRQFEGWNALLDAEMRRHYDPDMDEYSADPDEIADKLLKREIEAMQTELEPEAKPKPKPAAAKPNGHAKPKAPAEPPAAATLTPKMTASDEEDDAKVGGMTWAQRQARAINRAMARARGEIE